MVSHVSMKSFIKKFFLALLFAYILGFIFFLIKDLVDHRLSWDITYQSLFFFIVFLISPIMAIGKIINHIPVFLVVIVTAFFIYLIYKKVPSKFQFWLLTVLLIIWCVFGMMCFVFITGGA